MQEKSFPKIISHIKRKRKKENFMTDNFQAEQKDKYLEKSRDLLSDLPVFCTDFINDKLAATKYRPLTCYAYANDLNMFFDFLTCKSGLFSNICKKDISLNNMNQISYRIIADYLSYLTSYRDKNGNLITNDAPGKARKLSSIRALYNYLVKHHMVENNPAAAIDTPKIKEKPIIRLDKEQQEKLCEAAENEEILAQKKLPEYIKLRDNCILTMFLGTGIRVSELTGINISDIDFEKSCILITRKGNKVQNIYISPGIADSIKIYLNLGRKHFKGYDTTSALFLSQKGNRISIRAVEALVKKYANAALGMGNKISPHKLRSTYGTNLYNLTGDIYLTADALGHSDIKTTAKHYAAINEERRKQAARYGDEIIGLNNEK